MINKYINNEFRNQSFSKNELLYLLCITIVGAVIRIAYHNNRSFTGDEVGTLIFMEKSTSYILSHFELWLTMNHFILLEKFVSQLGGDKQTTLTIIPLIAGIATIPLTAILAKKLTTTKVALISATFVTMNAYLIAFSGIIRSYSLLTMLSLIVVIAFFNWFSNRTIRNGVYLSFVCYLLVLSHLNGIYILAYVCLIASIDFISSLTKREETKISTLLIPAILSVTLIAASYSAAYSAIVSYSNTPATSVAVGIFPWRDTPPTSITYIPYVFSIYFASGYLGWLSIILLISAITRAFKYEQPLLILVGYLILPIVLNSVQGTSNFPWGHARFLIFLIPICIIFIAEGIQYFSSLILSAIKSNNSVINHTTTILITMLLLITWTPNLRGMIYAKTSRPWNEVAQAIKETSEQNDLVLYISWSDFFDMYPYFSKSQHASYLLSAFTEEEYHKGIGRKILLVSSGPTIISDHSDISMGNIQVITYPVDTYSNQLLMIRNDLLKNIEKENISPDLADVYRNVWELNKRLNQDDSKNFRYYQLYIYSSQLTEGQRNIPLPLQQWELTNEHWELDLIRKFSTHE